MTNPFVHTGKIHGEIITWSPGGSVPYTEVLSCLRDCDLDEKLARELLPRHGIRRAFKKMDEGRIIRPLEEDEDACHFQFTREYVFSDRVDYDREARLSMDKKTGRITCIEKPELAVIAQNELTHAVETRTGSDITLIIQKLCERNADLFPIREQGGCYFVPQAHAQFLEKIERFVKRLGGRIRRYPVPEGTPQGDRSVKEAVSDGLKQVVAEYEQAVEEFDGDTRSSTLERKAEQLQQLKFKAQMYATMLEEQKAQVEAGIAAVVKKLKAKILAKAGTQPATASA